MNGIVVAVIDTSPLVALASVPIALPRPEVNKDWPEPGGTPDHAMQHPALPARLAQAWRVGQKGLDSGVIFLVFLDDRKMRIES